MITPKEVLLKAADLVEECRTSYACIAIGLAARHVFEVSSGSSKYKGKPEVYDTAIDKFTEMYKPHDTDPDEPWFGSPNGPGNRERRIAALREAAATFN